MTQTAESIVIADVTERVSAIADNIEKVILKCLEKDKEKRYQKIENLTLDLMKSKVPHRPASAFLTRKRLILPMLAVTILILLGVTILLWETRFKIDTSLSPGNGNSRDVYM